MNLSDKRILIDDGLMLARENPTGIGWYTLNLIHQLPKLGLTVHHVNYSHMFCRLPTPIKRLIYLASAFRNCARTDVDLIHYTNFYVPPRHHRAHVLSTVHDLTALHCPQTLTYNYRAYSRFAVRCAVRYADQILVPSEAIKTELLDRFSSIHENRITVVYQDVRDLFFEAGKTDFTGEREHFLYVGVLEKRKNLEFLIGVFQRFREKYPHAKLVLIGKPGYGYDQIAHAIAQCPGAIHHNYMPDNQLLDMYRRAYAVIMPSIYEGFGRPVIEAMAMHLPIIASDIPSNRELHSRHGKIMLFNLTRPDELVDLLKNTLTQHPDRIDYGNLEIYRTTAVAQRHLQAYLSLFQA